MTLSETVSDLTMKAVNNVKSFKGAKEYESKKGNTGKVLAEVGGYAGKDIGTVTKDGERYIVAIKYSVTARLDNGHSVSANGTDIL